MIRRLIKLLLIVGCVFADTIVVKTERKDKDGAVKTYNSEKMGEYVGILDAKAYLRVPSGKLTEFNCDDVISIFDDDKKPISWDCNESSFVPKTLNELDVKKLAKKPIIGGTLIAVGGLFLFNNLDKNCDDCETAKQVDDFLDEFESTQKIGYIFIILGGIFVALGI